MRRRSLPPGIPPLLACLALLCLWQIASLSYDLDGLPSVPATFAALPDLATDPDALLGLLASLRRVAIGFGLSLLLGVPLGLAIGRSRLVARLVNPTLMLSYPVPKAALMPLVMLWLGVGDAAKLLVIVLGASLPVIYHAAAGARAIEEKTVWSAAAMGLGRMARAIRVVLPAALPEIAVGARTGIVLALITMVTSEMVARQSGLGNVIFNALDLAQYPTVFAAILVVSALGIVLDILFDRVRSALVGWADAEPLVAPTTAA